MGKFVDVIDGVILTDLKIINNVKGDICHALKKSDSDFKSFGEAYFSFVNHSERKGWKMHTKMKLNLIVPVGEIEFCIYDNRQESKTFGNFYKISLSKNNYKRLTVSPGLWLSFSGISESENMLLNLSSIEHDPNESINMDLNSFPLP